MSKETASSQAIAIVHAAFRGYESTPDTKAAIGFGQYLYQYVNREYGVDLDAPYDFVHEATGPDAFTQGCLIVEKHMPEIFRSKAEQNGPLIDASIKVYAHNREDIAAVLEQIAGKIRAGSRESFSYDWEGSYEFVLEGEVTNAG